MVPMFGLCVSSSWTQFDYRREAQTVKASVKKERMFRFSLSPSTWVGYTQMMDENASMNPEIRQIEGLSELIGILLW